MKTAVISKDVSSYVEVTPIVHVVEVVHDNTVTVEVQLTTTSVDVVDQQTDVLTIGTQGPQGISEEDLTYAERTDVVYDVNGNVSGKYFGQAVEGSSDASAVWRISFTSYNTDYDGIKKWANGNSQFTNIWANHSSLSYS